MIQNVLLVRWQGGWIERTDATSIATYGRIEGALELGAQTELMEVENVADAQFPVLAYPVIAMDVGVEARNDSERAYISYDVGDTVNAPSPYNGRVVAITVTEINDTGDAIVTPSLGQLLTDPESARAQAVRKGLPGFQGGYSRVANPVARGEMTSAVVGGGAAQTAGWSGGIVPNNSTFNGVVTFSSNISGQDGVAADEDASGLTFDGGTGAATNGRGGSVGINGGTGKGTAQGGDILFVGGSALGSGAGGNVRFQGGTSASGTPGVLQTVNGAGAIANAPPGVLFDHFADQGNGTTVETDLYSDTLVASQLFLNGDKLRCEYGGVFVSSATATRQLKVYFAGTLIFDSGALTLSLSSAWDVSVLVIRESSTVIRAVVSMTTQGAALAAYTAYTRITGLTLSGTNILKITGQAAGVGAATNDIVAKLGYVEYVPA